MNKCNICSELNDDMVNIPSDYANIVKSKRNIILSSKDLVVLPSFGPLNNSHVMIVPRDHFFNFYSLSRDCSKQVEFLLDKLKEGFFNSFEEDLVFFESGAGANSNHSGGCIVHAHIHCVVQSKEFERSLFKEVELEEINDKTTFDVQKGYIWYKAADGKEYLKNNPLLPSQFLRYLYMQSSSTPASWNWRRNIDVGGMQSVIDTYRKIFI
ncbi:hypothetical protein Q9247_06320 [Halomonas meridiana]|uniref:HIT domain-containing protein n=1 Tax=Vreelandella aquamarina TaxID=77097 RepID=A0A857GHX7_9GAMM|nr:hypothetical protein [Halomonas meridiana]MDP4557290.1 hypothetical protein [Halomonas meridiana]QHD48825.1 hypothetical protein CTT34_03540 [Halomonas meridiana]|tara:strand:+ start:46 stop:678 length:633 start_codon:yes stop_codon:yes gene_type:complete